MPDRLAPAARRGRLLAGRRMAWLICVAAAASSFIAPCAAAREAPPLAADPALEARVMHIAEELRCLVCQNESLAASQADLAVDLRKQIRQKLQQGQSRAQIIDFLVQRYGDFVLYRPPLKPRNWLLWAGPFVLLALALGVLVVNIRKRRRHAAALTPADHQRARLLLEEGEGRGT